jgi:plasmid stability protein
MATLTIRRLDPAVKERLRVRAAQRGHSMEEEARRILSESCGQGVASGRTWPTSPCGSLAMRTASSWSYSPVRKGASRRGSADAADRLDWVAGRPFSEAAIATVRAMVIGTPTAPSAT